MSCYSFVRRLSLLSLAFAVMLLLSVGAAAQSNPTGTLSGVVTDPSGAAIPGAAIVVTDTNTQHVYNLQSDATGRFVLSNLSPDPYNVVVKHVGFQASNYKGVAIQVGETYTLNAKLTIGESSQTVEVQAGQQLIQAQTATVQSQVTGKEITQVPISSRNAQDLAIITPGMQTTTTPRNSQFDGLPPGSINITFDGINSQDQVLKSSTGSAFFSTEQPRLDDVQEFNITTAAGNAGQTGEGAVQLAIVSKKGTNNFHGGGWEYVRNDDLNANYYFNNQVGLPRQRLRLNEFGYKIGGPIIKNKLFFFTDMDIWRNPQGQLRTRDILTPDAAQGIYTYSYTGAAAPANTAWLACDGTGINANQPSGTCSANLFTMMTAATGTPQAEDSLESQIMATLAPSKLKAAPGVSFGPAPSFNQEEVDFNANAASKRYYPDLRLDYNINQTNSLEFDLHYDHYFDGPDVLNRADASYPIAPYSENVGSQISNRTLAALAWRTQLTPTINNELRIGGQSAPIMFDQGQTTAVYPTIATDDGTLRMRPSVPSLMSSPFNSFGPQGRNANTRQLNDTLSWLHGSHAMTIGASYTHVRWLNYSGGQAVSRVGLGLSQDDPQYVTFTGALGAEKIGKSDLSSAANLYGVLGGRVTSFSSSIYANPYTRKYEANYNHYQQISQNELGMFFDDSWHTTPTLTVNYGLRWEYEAAPVDDLNEYYMPVGNAAGVFGVSGYGNLFKPGTMPGSVTSFVNDQGKNWYSGAKSDWAPSLGLAWTPSANGGLLGMLFGNGGQSVLRAGYSVAFDRPGLSDFQSYAASNPGPTNNSFLNETVPGSVTPGSGQFAAGSILIGNQSIVGDGAAHEHPAGFQFGQPFPINTIAGQQPNAVAPGMAPPLIESWNIGFQRQLNSNTAIEFRYVGNHATRLREDEQINEPNIFENGFLKEFNVAAGNLAACQANATACETAQTAAGIAKPSANSFANWGLAGQGATPIMSAAFSGSTTNNTNRNFASGGLASDLQSGQAGDFASSIGENYADWQNLKAAGLPSNLFLANPDAINGGAYILTDIGQSTYNGLQVELRRRLSSGVQINANYTWSHSLGTGPLETLRTYGSTKAPSGSDLRSVFKFETLWELPFGKGHHWASSSSFVNTMIGGWEWDAITRWQSGDVFHVSGGGSSYTINDNSSGVLFGSGKSAASLASQLGVIKQGGGHVYYAPNSLLGNGGLKANYAVVGPCTTAGAFCQQPYLYGPGFFKSDWGIQKTTQLSEGSNLVIRAVALNLFNNINFRTPSSGSVDSNSFMRITSAYQDFTSTQDPGGRTIELQARINF